MSSRVLEQQGPSPDAGGRGGRALRTHHRVAAGKREGESNTAKHTSSSLPIYIAKPACPGVLVCVLRALNPCGAPALRAATPLRLLGGGAFPAPARRGSTAAPSSMSSTRRAS